MGFISEYSKENTFISEVTSKNSIGNTPGEISLVYYKFLIQEKEADFCVLAIDQPEDDINPKRINNFLLQYLGSISDITSLIRIALTSKKDTFDLYEIMRILGPEEIAHRIALFLKNT